MGHTEEIEFLDGIREAALRRLEECEREAALTESLGGGDAGDEEIARRRKKLRARADRYRVLARRVESDARGARRRRLTDLEGTDFAGLYEEAVRLHHRARRLEAALGSARERYRGLRMRHIALEREAADLCRTLGLPRPDHPEPPEIRADLGTYDADGKD